MNQELFGYIKKAREDGQSDEQIRQALLVAGWQGGDIEEIFNILQGAVSFGKNNTVVRWKIVEHIKNWANYKKAIAIILVNAIISTALLDIFSTAILFLGIALGPIFGYKEALAVFVFAPYAFIIISLLFVGLVPYFTRHIFGKLLNFRVNYFCCLLAALLLFYY